MAGLEGGTEGCSEEVNRDTVVEPCFKRGRGHLIDSVGQVKYL